MARKTSIVLIAAMMATLMASSRAPAQAPSPSASDLKHMDCSPIMKDLRNNKRPRDVAAELNVPIPTVYKCMKEARAARTKRIGEPSPGATKAGVLGMATPSPTPIM